ncbi:MAG TPA: phospholipase D-like domain-containing protein, partial [bacterium]|nr:phospholipase D-like domain-containing protein [bacterium]
MCLHQRGEAAMKLLPNPDYFPWLLAAVGRAKRSVVLVNYLAAMGEPARGPVFKLARALAAACRRGVRVEATLEGSKFRENMPFYRYIKSAGADAWMDTSLTFIHTKAILIDGRLLCVGSHNLSTSALTSHHELSAATREKAPIRAFLRELVRMTRQKREIDSSTCRDGSRAPIGALVAIKRMSSPHAYLLYLLLCREDGGKPRPIRIDAEAWARELGLPASTASAGVRIAAILERLERKLGVVTFDGEGGWVKRRVVSGQWLVVGAHQPPTTNHQSPGSILIPESFWRFGWHRALSVEAMHLYFAGEAERQTSPFAPWWRLTRDETAARYGFQKQIVNRAQRELKR